MNASTDDVDERIRELGAGDEIVLPSGDVLEILEADHVTSSVDDSYRRSEFKARKESGQIVDLREHHVENALAGGAEIESATVEVDVLYTRFGDEAETDEAQELSRDLRTFADPDDVLELDADEFEAAYKRLGEPVEVRLDDVVDEDNRRAVIAHIYDRLQGGRVDDELPYDGSTTRSATLGDIIVVDGRAALVGEIASFPDLGDAEHLPIDDVEVLGGAGE